MSQTRRWRTRSAAVAAALFWIATGAASAQTCLTSRVSVDSTGLEGDQASGSSALSRTGRFIAFVSSSTNLIAADTNNTDDVFVHDRVLMTTERVSESSAGVGGNTLASYPSISSDGRFVVFSSWSHNLVPNDLNNATDVFLRDRALGTTERISTDALGVEGNSSSYLGSISKDGRFVAFISYSSNLVANDVNGARDVFLLDRTLGTMELVSLANDGSQGTGPAGGNTGGPFASDDGRFVAFQSSAPNLVAGDTNGKIDAFVRDRLLGTTTRLSLGPGGVEPDGDCDVSGMTPDGRFVAVVSNATNLVPNDTNGTYDTFVIERATGTVERVSVTSSGQEGSSQSWVSSISDDGRFVAFTSIATNLVPGDLNAKRDVFVHDRAAHTTELVSHTDVGNPVNSDCYFVTIAGDGRSIVFTSAASNLVSGDTNFASDVFVKECRSAQLFCSGTNASCPCGNAGDGQSGCATAVTSGALLDAVGQASVGGDTLTLVASGLPPGAPVAFLSGLQPVVPATGVLFGNGLRCIDGQVTVMAVRQASFGTSVFGFVNGDPLLSVVGNVPSGGDYRHYQAWYRSIEPFCTGAGYNLSNGATILWAP